MFYLIGLGLCDEKDITVRGLEVPDLTPLKLLVLLLIAGTLVSQTLNKGLPRGIHKHIDGAKRAAGEFFDS